MAEQDGGLRAITPEERRARDVARAKEPYRIEALRAAARVVAPILSEIMAGHLRNGTVWDGSANQVKATTLVLAEQFARWIETGKR